MDKGTYFRKVKNALDFFIVCLQLFDLATQQSRRSPIKVLRLFRTLRPLRVITHSKSMQVLMLTLTRSLKALANVLLMLLVVWIMFAVLGVQLFQGRFYYCSGTDYKYAYGSESECNIARGQWTTYFFNFDDIWASTTTLIAISSLNNWEDQMYAAIDSTGVDQGP